MTCVPFWQSIVLTASLLRSHACQQFVLNSVAASCEAQLSHPFT